MAFTLIEPQEARWRAPHLVALARTGAVRQQFAQAARKEVSNRS